MIPKIAALAWHDLTQILRTPAQLFMTFVLPLVFTLIAGQAFSAADKPALVPFVDGDRSVYSRQVGELLGREDSFEIEEVSVEEAERLVADGDAAAAVIVAKGFGEALEAGNAEVEVLVDPSSDAAQAVAAVAEGIAVRMSGNAAAARAVDAMRPLTSRAAFADTYRKADARWEPAPPISVEGTTATASKVRGQSVQANGATQASAGFALYFALFMIFGGAGGILEEREQKTLSRLLATPTSQATILAGKVAGIMLAGVVQVLIFIVSGALIFDVPWGGNVLANTILLLAFILAATGLAVLTSTIVRNRDQFSGLTPLLATGLAMIGGCFWPLDIVGPTMRTIAKATPTGWAMTGLIDVLARNHGFEAVWLPALILVGFAIATFSLGILFLKWE